MLGNNNHMKRLRVGFDRRLTLDPTLFIASRSIFRSQFKSLGRQNPDTQLIDQHSKQIPDSQLILRRRVVSIVIMSLTGQANHSRLEGSARREQKQVQFGVFLVFRGIAKWLQAELTCGFLNPICIAIRCSSKST